MSAPIRVVVYGALGRVGREVVMAACKDPDLQPVGAVDARADADALPLPVGKGSIPLSRDLESILAQTRPGVIVDFTTAEASLDMVRAATKHKVNVVIGSTGFSPQNLEEIDRLARENEVGAVVASNFALGAVLLMHFARIAARYFDHAEIIELHHDQKADAPSGTALTTARLMRESRGADLASAATTKTTLEGVRGGVQGGINIHSVRLPGLVAHQEVIFGGLGQTLTLRHDSISRESFVPGVLMAVKEVVKRQDLVTGLESLLGL